MTVELEAVEFVVGEDWDVAEADVVQHILLDMSSVDMAPHMDPRCVGAEAEAEVDPEHWQ